MLIIFNSTSILGRFIQIYTYTKQCHRDLMLHSHTYTKQCHTHTHTHKATYLLSCFAIWSFGKGFLGDFNIKFSSFSLWGTFLGLSTCLRGCSFCGVNCSLLGGVFVGVLGKTASADSAKAKTRLKVNMQLALAGAPSH